MGLREDEYARCRALGRAGQLIVLHAKGGARPPPPRPWGSRPKRAFETPPYRAPWKTENLGMQGRKRRLLRLIAGGRGDS